MSGDDEPVVAPQVAKSEPNLESLKADLDAQIASLEGKIGNLGNTVKDKVLLTTYSSHLTTLLEKRSNVYSSATPVYTNPSQNADPKGASTVNADLKNVKKFYGKNFDDTERFLKQITQIFDAEISPASNRAELETYFLRRIKASYIERDVFDKLRSEGSSVSSLTEFCDFIRKHYLPKENAFQICARVFEEDWCPHKDKIHVTAQKIDTRAKVAHATFKAMWEKEKSDTVPTVEDAFLFFGGTHLFNIIREKEPQTSRDMVNKLDTVFSATELASRAEFYRDQNGNSGEVLYSKPAPKQKRGKNSRKAQPKEPKKETGSSKAKTKSKTPDVLTLKAEHPSPPWKSSDSNQGLAPDGRGSLVKDQDFH